MPNPALSAVGRVARALDPDPPTDAALVERFAAGRDEAAFAELLRRHGPTVLGVCRRVAGPDADDAFQAAFVVLARRAGTVRPPGRVGAFLYGVAVRTATKAKIMAARRRRHELASRGCEPPGDPPADGSDLRPVIDEELGRLPDGLRAAVVLCDLGGKSRSEAARELGLPEGTVATRLAKARRVLAARLTRRGVTLSAAGLAAAVPPDLAASTLSAALGTSAVPPAVQLLAGSAMRSMSAAPWKFPAGLLLLVCVAGSAVWAALPGPPAGQSPPPAKDKPAGVAEGWKARPAITCDGWFPGSVAYSKDGKVLAVGGTGGRIQAFDAATAKSIWQAKLDANFSAVAFIHDDKLLAATFKDGVTFLDPATGKVGESIIRKDSNPTVVATFPDEPVENDPRSRRHKIAFDGPGGTHICNWVRWSQIEAYCAGAYKGVEDVRRPAGEVALAADPGGEYALVTGQIRDRSEKFELHAVHVIRKPDQTGFDRRGGFVLGGQDATTAYTTYCAAWSKDRGTVVSGNEDGVVILWNMATRREKARVRLDGRIAAVAVNADGSRVAAAAATPTTRNGVTAYSESVYVWEPKAQGKGNQNPPPALPMADDRPLDGPFKGMVGLAFSPDGRELTAGFANFDHLAKPGNPAGVVRTWRLAAK